MRLVFAEPAIGRPTGSMSGKPLDAVAWTGSTPLTVKRSKISTFIRWCAMRGNGYAWINIEEGTIMATKKSAVPPEIYQLKVTLLGTSPPIWRRLLVPAAVTLAQLHD